MFYFSDSSLSSLINLNGIGRYWMVLDGDSFKILFVPQIMKRTYEKEKEDSQDFYVKIF